MSGRRAQCAESSDLMLGLGLDDRWEAAVRKETQKGEGAAAEWVGPWVGSRGEVRGSTIWGGGGWLPALLSDGVALSAVGLSGMAGDKVWAIWSRKSSSLTADVGGVSSVLFSQCSSSKSRAIWTWSCPSHKLLPRDCSGSHDWLACPGVCVHSQKGRWHRIHYSGFAAPGATIWGCGVRWSQVSPAACTAMSFNWVPQGCSAMLTQQAPRHLQYHWCKHLGWVCSSPAGFVVLGCAKDLLEVREDSGTQLTSLQQCVCSDQCFQLTAIGVLGCSKNGYEEETLKTLITLLTCLHTRVVLFKECFISISPSQ